MTRPKHQGDEDEAQSRRFIETAEDLAAQGELDLSKAGEVFDDAFSKIVPPKTRRLRRPRQ